MRRYFHVSNQYSEYANLNPSVALHEIKQDLLKQYESVATGASGIVGAGSKAEAEELQNFFQDIKTYSAVGSAAIKSFGVDSLASNINIEILDRILQTALTNSDFRTVNNWFQRSSSNAKNSGEIFEKELAAIVNATIQTANKPNASTVDYKDLIIGGGNIETNVGDINSGAMQYNDLKAMVENQGREFLPVGGKALQKIGKDFLNHTDKYVTKKVMMKIDVTGLNATLDLSAEASPTLARIATLLHQATFSAKSYTSLYASVAQIYIKTYDKIYQSVSYIKSTRSTIHLGETEARRIILDILSLRYPFPVALSMYYAIARSSSSELKNDLVALRFMYELTGVGQQAMISEINQVLKANSSLGAKYLIYNDPASSNIYVTSTAELITKVSKDFARYVSKNNSVNLSKFLASSGNQFY